MTRKDYVAIANAFRETRNFVSGPDQKGCTGSCNGWLDLRCLIANAFEADNERFDRERFYVACEVTP